MFLIRPVDAYESSEVRLLANGFDF